MALIPRGFRVYCNKKLEHMVVIGNETLEFLVDGINYTVTLATGVYRTYHEQFESELPSMITRVLEDAGVPVICRLGGVYDFENNRTVLVFEHSDTASHHDLDIIGGTAFDMLIGSVLDADEYEDGVFEAVSETEGSILVVYPGFDELSAALAIRNSVKDDSFTGNVVIRRLGGKDLTGFVYIVSASRIEGTLSVRRNNQIDINSSIAVPTSGEFDIGSFLTVNVP